MIKFTRLWHRVSSRCRIWKYLIQAYGKTTYLVTTLKRVPRGTEGAISLEGTVSGIISAVFLAIIAVFFNQVHVKQVCCMYSDIVHYFCATWLPSV